MPAPPRQTKPACYSATGVCLVPGDRLPLPTALKHNRQTPHTATTTVKEADHKNIGKPSIELNNFQLKSQKYNFINRLA